MLEALKTGNFLRPPWLSYAPLAALLIFLACVLASGQEAGQPTLPPGSDFSDMWVAGTSVLDGQPSLPFDRAQHFQKQKAYFGENTALYAWLYPPYYLALAAAVALLPYLGGLALWQGTTLGIYLLAITAILPNRRFVLAALTYPAVLINLVHGQNGFLTAALLGIGLNRLERNRVGAGLWLGLLACKPQFGLLIPLVLAVTGRWQTFLSATATVAAMTLASVWAFGIQPWLDFYNGLEWARSVVLEQGMIGTYKMQSPFAAARLYGASVPLAYILQIAISLSVALAVVWLWLSGADRRVQCAGLISAILLATPYCFDYDLVVMGPAMAFLLAHGLERGFGPYEKSAIAAAWIAPLFARLSAFYLGLPLGFLSIAAFFLVCFGHALRDGTVRLPAFWRTPENQSA